MKKIPNSYFIGMCFDNKKVEVLIQETKYKRKELIIHYGKERINVVDVWSYQKTAGIMNEIKHDKQDTLSRYLFKETQPTPGWFNDMKVMFIHPEDNNPNILMVWCVELDEVEWISKRYNGQFYELKVSTNYATKFGLWSLDDYK